MEFYQANLTYPLEMDKDGQLLFDLSSIMDDSSKY